MRNSALLAMRLMLGIVFIYHGVGKVVGEGGIAGFAGHLEGMNVPFPMLGAWLSMLAELVGGILLIISSGWLFRLTTIPMTINMLVAGLVAHSGFDARTGGGEYPLTLAVMLLALGLLGAGRWTLPDLIFRGK